MIALPSATFFDVGGRRLAARFGGVGRACVVFEGGLGIESAEWAAVATQIAAVARVCVYDRANRGASDPAPKPRGAIDAVRDLRALLAQAGAAGPLVLVGHSYGGLLARLHAWHYPDAISGIVLVDPMHEDQFDELGRLFPVTRAGEPGYIDVMRQFWLGGWRDAANNAEGVDLPLSRQQLRDTRSLGAVPLRVLTAGAYINEGEFGAAAQALQNRWQALHAKLARLSSRGTQQLVLDSGHFMQRDRPDVIADAIRAMLTELWREHGDHD